MPPSRPPSRGVGDPDGLVERATPLAALGEALSSARAGRGRIVLVEAAPGLGKTALLDAAAAMCGAQGVACVRASGSELSRLESMGLVSRLVVALAAADPAAPTRRVRALGSRSAAGGARELEWFTELWRHLETLASAAPTAVVLDDLHWSDPSSLRFLLYAAQRLDDVSLCVLAGARPVAGEARELLDRISLERVTTTLELDPLSAAGTQFLIRRRVPGGSTAVCEELATLCAGNPLLAEAAARAWVDEGEGQATAAAAARRAARALAPSVRHRLAGLGDPAIRLARAVAVLDDHSPLSRAVALAGISSGVDAAEALVGAWLLDDSPEPVFVHPLIRQSVLDGIGAARTAELHARAAELLARDGVPDEQIASHLLRASRAGCHEVIERLRSAARIALSRGSTTAAVRYLARALEEPPVPSERAGILLELAEAEALAGDDRALEHFTTASRLAEPRARAAITLRHAEALFQVGRPVEARDRLAQALGEANPALAEQDREKLRTALVGIEALVGAAAPCAWDAQEGIASMLVLPRSGARCEALTRVSTAMVLACEDRDRAAELAWQALDGEILLRDGGVSLVFSMAVGTLLWADCLDRADLALEAAVRHAEHLGSECQRAFALFGRAWSRYFRGQVGQAIVDAEVAVAAWRGGWNVDLPSAGHWLAISLLEHGQIAGARQALDDTRPGTGGSPLGEALWRDALGRVHLARGDASAAVEELEAVERLGDVVPLLHNPAVLGWRSRLAVALHRRDGATPRVSGLIEEELRLARSFGAPRALGVALRGAALTCDVDALELMAASTAVLEASPSVLERTRALVDLGALSRARGHREDARVWLRRAQALTDAGDMPALRWRVLSELRATGARPGQRRVSGVLALTPQERRVAELAATGRSNPAIAGELFITRKTVEFHLAGAFRKLDIHRRDQLRAVLESEQDSLQPNG